MATGTERIREDLDAGRLWKARDRVTGAFSSDPTNPEVLELAGEVFFRMGDLPRAALFWLLTDRTGPDVDEANTAMRERYPRASDVVAALPIRGEITLFPHGAQIRLLDLQRELSAQGRKWEPSGRQPHPQPVRESRFSEVVAVTFLIALLVAILGTWAVGALTVARWLTGVF